ncbi:MAG TPA: autorepressor SdpR family transcription factor [Candidatus Hydrogenedentes bacterium]|nr:autorepressor SdpR family transcription factor [Candidatus Hydrogenedentota bacterium]HRK35715.1 autorepressor SdpR family transcription factor [Candidatus Hydrogenedentota bacterium]
MNLVFKALADPTRRRILQLLRSRDMTAGEIAENFPLAKPTLSRHFSVLREADLIQGDKSGTSITYRLNVSVLEEALLGLMNAFRIETGEIGNGDGTA